MKTTDSRARVLDAAETLFQAHGYSAVSMRAIADALAIRQASLYYHAPGGKEELFVAVLQRLLARYRQGLLETIADAAPNAIDQLHAVAAWLAAQPPLRLLKLVEVDLPQLGAAQQAELLERIWSNLYLPLMVVFTQGQSQGVISPAEPGRLAGACLAQIDEALMAVRAGFSERSAAEEARIAVDRFIAGAGTR